MGVSLSPCLSLFPAIPLSPISSPNVALPQAARVLPQWERALLQWEKALPQCGRGLCHSGRGLCYSWRGLCYHFIRFVNFVAPRAINQYVCGQLYLYPTPSYTLDPAKA